MGSAQVAIPPGFVLDEPLPPGFVLDGGEPKKSGAGGGRGFVNPDNVKEPLSPFEQALQSGISAFGKLHGPRDLGEAAATIATGAIARPVGLMAGAVGGMLPGPDGQAERWLHGTQKALTHTPDEGGQAVLNDIGGVVNAIADKTNIKQNIKRAGEAVDRVGEASPVAGAALQSVPDLLMLAGMRAPLNNAMSSTKNVVADLARNRAEWAMNSALKPTLKAHETGDAAVAVDTALKYGLNPTQGGMEKLRALIDDTNEKIAAAIKNSKATVSRDAVASRVDPVMSRFANQAAPVADVSAVQSVLDQFGLRPESLTVQQAQALKQGTYQKLSKAYNGELGTASIDAQKAIARGLKEEVANVVPELSGLNATDTALYKTLDVMERRTLLEMNKNPLGLSMLAHSPMGWAAYMADKSAAFKAIVARMLNATSEGLKGGSKGPKPNLGYIGDPTLGYGAEVPSKPVPVNPLGDLTPDWTTAPGAGGPKAPSIEGAGLFPSFDDPRVGSSRLKGRPQMPVVPGLPGLADTAIAGKSGVWQYGDPWVDAKVSVGPEQSRLAAAPMSPGGIELSRLINMPKSGNRTKLLNDFKKRYPHAAKYIDENM